MDIEQGIIPVILLGLLVLGGLGIAAWLYWRCLLRHRLTGWRFALGQFIAAVLWVAVLLSFGGGGVLGYFYFRPQPADIQVRLFEGVSYERVSQREPFPLVYHVVRISLDAPGLSFFVTPPDLEGEFELRAQTTTQFLRKHQLQLAINGNFFYPSHANNPWDYYPVSGEPVAVLGEAASSGDQYSSRATHYIPVSISDENTILFGEAEGGYNILAGKYIDLTTPVNPPESNGQRLPRTAFALDRDSNTLILLVADGRQPNYSEGLSLEELRELLIALGADEAINLDGGGSSTLVMQLPDGRTRVLNSPIHTRIPGRERPVANHLGIYAPPLPEPDAALGAL